MTLKGHAKTYMDKHIKNHQNQHGQNRHCETKNLNTFNELLTNKIITNRVSFKIHRNLRPFYNDQRLFRLMKKFKNGLINKP